MCVTYIDKRYDAITTKIANNVRIVVIRIPIVDVGRKTTTKMKITTTAEIINTHTYDAIIKVNAHTNSDRIEVDNRDGKRHKMLDATDDGHGQKGRE